MMNDKIKIGDVEIPAQMTKYVYEGTEVVLTGRKATRKIEGRGRVSGRVDTKHEVQPADPEMGSWKKWVRLEDLYEIQYD